MKMIKFFIVKVQQWLRCFSSKLDSSVCYFLSVTGIAFILKKIKLNELFSLDYYKLIRLFGYLKNNVGPYKYTILMFLVLGYNYNGNRLSSNRVIRFFLILMMLLVYKMYHNYIKDTKIDKINVKGIYYLMNINVIQNPVLYIIGKGDLYLYEIQDVLNKYNKYKSINTIIMLLLVNVSMPIKILFKKYYMMLIIVKQSTLGELLFIRIYGLIFSILIFSNIIRYIYKITGSIGNLLLCIYVILYVISVIYTIINYLKQEKKLENIMNTDNKYILGVKNISKKLKKMLFFKYIINYIDMISDLNIYKLYEKKLHVSSTSYLIADYILKTAYNNQQITTFFRLYIYKMPNVGRYIIYKIFDIKEIKGLNKKQLSDLSYTVIDRGDGLSYVDMIRFGHLDSLQLKNFKYFINYNNNKYIYYNIYSKIFFNLDDLFKSLETLIYYKYYNYKKAYIEYCDGMYNEKGEIMTIQEYEYAYKLYVLILKNVLHFIGTFEYNYYGNKEKLTKLYVIKNKNLDWGLHINLKNVDDDFFYEKAVTDTLYQKKLNNKLNNKIYENIYESIFIMSHLIPIYSGTYINYKNNESIKDLYYIYFKYLNKLESQNGYPNLLLDLKPEYVEDYYMELNTILKQIYQEGDMKDPYDIFDKRDVYYELENHLKIKCHLF